MKRISLACALVGCVLLVWFGMRWTSESDHRSDPSSALSSEAHEASPQREALTAAHPQVTREATPASMEMSTPSAPHEEAPEPVPDDLRIRVIDSTSGACTDIVALRIYWLPTSGNSSSQKQLFEGRPDGPELEVRLARAAIEVAEYGPPPEGQLQITALGAFVPKVSMCVLLQPWPTEPIELVLPPHCVVRFRAQDERGNFLSEGGTVRARFALPDRSQPVVDTAMHNGVSEALFCTPNLELKLSGRLQSGRRILHAVEHVPNQPGVVHWIDLQLSAVPAVIFVKLVLESGEPLRNVEVQTSEAETRNVGGRALSSSSMGSKHTDSDGYLQWALDDPSAAEGLIRNIAFTHEHALYGVISGYLDYSRGLSSGKQDLGVVVMKEEPVLASGVVVDSGGHGIPDASINASLYNADQMYPMVDTLRTTTDAEGRFLLRSIIPAERVELDIFAKGFVQPERLKVPRGTQNIVVAVVSAASLAGSFRLPEGMDMGLIVPRLEHHEDMGQPQRANRFLPQIDAQGGFTAQDLWPGMATVHFWISGGDPVFSVPDVQLVSGEVNRDPRLQDVQLCEGWRRLRLQLLDEKKATLDRATFSLVSDNGELQRTLTTDREGLCTTWIEPQHRRFTIHAERFRSVTIERSEDIQVLQLSSGLRVSVPIQVELQPPITGIELRLAKASVKSASATMIHGVAEVMVSEPGRYRLVPALKIYAEGLNVQRPWEPDPPIFVDIEDLGVQTLPTLHITKKMIQAVLDRK